MIGLEFVKKIDNDWEKKINRLYIRKYDDDYCPYCGSTIDIVK
jgi:hypothetical protein